MQWQNRREEKLSLDLGMNGIKPNRRQINLQKVTLLLCKRQVLFTTL